MKEYAVFVPGLGDFVPQVEALVKPWEGKGFEPVVYNFHWSDRSVSFHYRLEHFVNFIDRLAKSASEINLVGLSAGGSAVLNAFIERRNAVNKVAAVCSRINSMDEPGYRSFEARTVGSPNFRQSIRLLETRAYLLTSHDRRKIMTVRAQFGDQLVPGKTAILPGAHNIAISTAEHFTSIAMALTLYSKPLADFLKN